MHRELEEILMGSRFILLGAEIVIRQGEGLLLGAVKAGTVLSGHPEETENLLGFFGWGGWSGRANR